ncbi:hypothetical protein, partial [Acanthopleuribacter pedis]
RPNGEEASIRQIYREDSNFRAWLQIKPLAHFPIVLVLNLTALTVLEGGKKEKTLSKKHLITTKKRSIKRINT